MFTLTGSSSLMRGRFTAPEFISFDKLYKTCLQRTLKSWACKDIQKNSHVTTWRSPLNSGISSGNTTMFWCSLTNPTSVAGEQDKWWFCAKMPCNSVLEACALEEGPTRMSARVSRKSALPCPTARVSSQLSYVCQARVPNKPCHARVSCKCI